MTTTIAPAPPTGVVTAHVADYYEALCAAARIVGGTRTGDNASFMPDFDLPPLTPALRRYFDAGRVDISPPLPYGDTELRLLNLMGNPETRTTKTIASLLMVARAVHHIQRTGESIMLLTPSSANKATALRDAVHRAVAGGLVTMDQLRITVVVPEASRPKLWSSPLATDPELAARNPVLVYPGPERSQVKTLAQAVVGGYADALHAVSGVRLWYSLDIDNYRMADAVRAFIEYDHLPTRPGVGRLHAHAVSSAYGLLGHHLGRTLSGLDEARYFLVQHLDTPDMVLSLYYGSTSREFLPRYQYDAFTGLHTQRLDERFPTVTSDPDEILDPTFYTHNPPTSDQMNDLIRRNGGGGIVVSLHECLQRYPQIRALLAPAGVALPSDPRRLREWSLVMAATGVLNGIDRGLITDPEVVLHGSGSYGVDDFEPLARAATSIVTTECDLRSAVFNAALVGAPC